MADQAESARIAASISDALSLLHIRYYGKGPSGVTTFLENGYVFCVLKDPFTQVEQTLIEGDKRQDVRDRRQKFEDLMAARFTRTVEEITGRKVIAFVRQTHVAPDLAIEIFKFEEPQDDVL